jgi:hypothetical protein
MNRMTADKKLLDEREERSGGTIGNCIGTRNHTVFTIMWKEKMSLGLVECHQEKNGRELPRGRERERVKRISCFSK